MRLNAAQKIVSWFFDRLEGTTVPFSYFAYCGILFLERRVLKMSKYRTIDIWNRVYREKQEAYDYAGRLMKKSACGKPNSPYHPTLDHIRPLSKGGCDVPGNIIICHRDTNAEKADHFPHWKTNGTSFHARRVNGSRVEYKIIIED